MSQALFAEAVARAARREPFAMATVVRAERPTSAKPGAKALVSADGALHGWVGGSCAAPTVIREALEALADGEPRLVLLSNDPQPPRPGLRQVPMTCLSGGTLEIYIEPMLPREQLVVIGATPVARALSTLGAALGLEVATALERVDARSAVVVATRDEGDEDAVAEALRTPARYISLVASRTRGDAIVEALAATGTSRAELARVKYPAGLDIHARSEEEIALSILAEIVALRPQAVPQVAVPEAIDPICGMTVAITPDALRAVHEGVTYYFCAESCRRRFLKERATVHAP